MFPDFDLAQFVRNVFDSIIAHGLFERVNHEATTKHLKEAQDHGHFQEILPSALTFTNTGHNYLVAKDCSHSFSEERWLGIFLEEVHDLDVKFREAF